MRLILSDKWVLYLLNQSLRSVSCSSGRVIGSPSIFQLFREYLNRLVPVSSPSAGCAAFVPQHQHCRKPNQNRACPVGKSFSAQFRFS
jgi:hypothetical protein